MNILFFLSPKQDLMYVYDDFTLRQTLEKWENNRYASIPVLNRKGEYVGTLTEGDILWGLKKFHGLDLEAAEDIPIRDFAHKRDYKAVTVTTSMDQLIEAAMNQNFVPVVDDRECSSASSAVRPSSATATTAPALPPQSSAESPKSRKNESRFLPGCSKTGKGPAALHEMCRAAGSFYACGKGRVVLQPTVRLESVNRWVRTASAFSPPIASSSSTERVVEQRTVWKAMVSMPSARS